MKKLQNYVIFSTFCFLARAWISGEKNLKVRTRYKILNFPALFQQWQVCHSALWAVIARLPMLKKVRENSILLILSHFCLFCLIFVNLVPYCPILSQFPPFCPSFPHFVPFCPFFNFAHFIHFLSNSISRYQIETFNLVCNSKQ